MAQEQQPQEKTEEPSAKRLKEAREKGQVVRSRDFNATVILLVTSFGFLIFGHYLASHLVVMMRACFEFDASLLMTTAITFAHLSYLSQYGIKATLPLMIMILILSLATPLSIGGWTFSREVVRPKLSRLNPMKGLARIVSKKGLVEVVKSFLKFLLIGGVSILVLKLKLPGLLLLGNAPLEVAISEGTTTVIEAVAWIASSLLIIALLDVPFQLYEHHQQMRMSKQELKDEYKDTEGKPEVKSAIRRAQQAAARRRMMSEVPKADVILTNPTHYAVAISYKNKKRKAPVVVAKGKNLIAFQISSVAQKSKIPIICVPPLTRAIYFSTKLNKEIPRGLYIAVAQVLAYIFHLSDKERYDPKPSVLQDVLIPPDLARDIEDDLNDYDD